MASYGRKRKLRKKKKYRLPMDEPRGDAPGGVYPRRSDAGDSSRRDDIRYANRYSRNVRRYPDAPFGRFEDGTPLPENLSIRRGRPIPNARRSRRYQRI